MCHNWALDGHLPAHLRPPTPPPLAFTTILITSTKLQRPPPRHETDKAFPGHRNSTQHCGPCSSPWG
ncbi:hypothetical protein E2C01_100297 [Portunus trituberculatus]|uniref:Uncharacterized protein n=1 Tax=Portunus trituberculatus TaxID=210409 RepID=A0A5B7K6G3_PORTR|nr:hypothetical protein [Portunus trituberculatus]